MVKVIVTDVLSNDWDKFTVRLARLHFLYVHLRHFPEKLQRSRSFSCSFVECLLHIQHVDGFYLFNDS